MEQLPNFSQQKKVSWEIVHKHIIVGKFKNGRDTCVLLKIVLET